MERRAFIGALTGGLLAAPLVAEAQPAGKVPRIGWLGPDQAALRREILLEALRDLGYVEGRNIEIDPRGGPITLKQVHGQHMKRHMAPQG